MTNPTTQQQGPRKKAKTRFGAQLEEKQNLKGIYGLRENQLKQYYAESQRSPEETGMRLISLLEKRIDNAIYRAGLAETRAQARQMVSHGLFAVNGRSTNIPSHRLRINDLVTIKESKRGKSYFTNFEKRLQNAQPPSWLELIVDDFGFKVTSEPTFDEANIGVAIQDIVEFLAR